MRSCSWIFSRRATAEGLVRRVALARRTDLTRVAPLHSLRPSSGTVFLACGVDPMERRSSRPTPSTAAGSTTAARPALRPAATACLPGTVRSPRIRRWPLGFAVETLELRPLDRPVGRKSKIDFSRRSSCESDSSPPSATPIRRRPSCVKSRLARILGSHRARDSRRRPSTAVDRAGAS